LVDVDAPGKLFLLGTDGYGRDEFSRLLFGARISLFAGILATSIALGLGVLVGGLAGYSGRFADEFLMRLSEIFLAVPWLYLLLAVRAFLPLHLSPAGAFLLLITVIGAVGWARPARLIRGIVLSVKERNFVLAARGFGGSGWYLLRRHILPQTSGVVLTQAGLLIPQFILAEVTLSFLGLGVGEPVPSWGSLLAQLQHYDVLIRSWWILTPAFVLFFTSWAYSTIAHGYLKHE
jgi:peptide/nickel transport system permease protein